MRASYWPKWVFSPASLASKCWKLLHNTTVTGALAKLRKPNLLNFLKTFDLRVQSWLGIHSYPRSLATFAWGSGLAAHLHFLFCLFSYFRECICRANQSKNKLRFSCPAHPFTSLPTRALVPMEDMVGWWESAAYLQSEMCALDTIPFWISRRIGRRDFRRIFGFSRQISDAENFQPSPRILTEKSEILTEISAPDSG